MLRTPVATFESGMVVHGWRAGYPPTTPQDVWMADRGLVESLRCRQCGQPMVYRPWSRFVRRNDGMYAQKPLRDRPGRWQYRILGACPDGDTVTEWGQPPADDKLPKSLVVDSSVRVGVPLNRRMKRQEKRHG